MSKGDSIGSLLLQKTGMFGLRLWVVIGIVVGGFTVLVIFFLSLRLSAMYSATWRKSKKCEEQQTPTSIDVVYKDIKEVVDDSHNQNAVLKQVPDDQSPNVVMELGHLLCASEISDGEKEVVTFRYTDTDELTPSFRTVKSKTHSYAEMVHGLHSNIVKGAGPESTTWRAASSSDLVPDHELAWGHCYSVGELEVATNQFAARNVVGEGGYGVVYQGLLPDGSLIAVKNLLNDSRGQAEKEFRGEVEAIGRVRHKNLVRLLGYCTQGSCRMLVYEYVDNGNLDQWLHGSLGAKDPISWDARMKIVLGTAKGLAYLHEDLEPKVVHRDIKSSNILLDSSWNAKVSDFGLAKLLDAGMSHVTTRVMGTFGYVAPEYASTGLLTERSDVYSFGVLMMELITGRNPVDYSRPVGEVNLVDWMKMMVGSRRLEEILDPRLKEKPSGRALKRALLVALRCVDPEALKRPRMGHVVHMLEADDFSFHNVCRNSRDGTRGGSPKAPMVKDT
eukprot:c22556_g1_i1 orf=688-2196(+)